MSGKPVRFVNLVMRLEKCTAEESEEIQEQINNCLIDLLADSRWQDKIVAYEMGELEHSGSEAQR